MRGEARGGEARQTIREEGGGGRRRPCREGAGQGNGGRQIDYTHLPTHFPTLNPPVQTFDPDFTIALHCKDLNIGYNIGPPTHLPVAVTRPRSCEENTIL